MTVAYQVVSNVLVRKHPESRVLNVVVDSSSAAQLDATVDDLIAALRGTASYLELFLYAEAQAIAWRGWFAHATLNTNGAVMIKTNNDPGLRQAVYEEFH